VSVLVSVADPEPLKPLLHSQFGVEARVGIGQLPRTFAYSRPHWFVLTDLRHFKCDFVVRLPQTCQKPGFERARGFCDRDCDGLLHFLRQYRRWNRNPPLMRLERVSANKINRELGYIETQRNPLKVPKMES